MTQTLEAAREISAEKLAFFDAADREHLSLTYDDVIAQARSGLNVDLSELSTTSNFSTHVELKLPIVSAAMDTITESQMAIAMAKMGGLGIIHAGLTIESQKEEVRKVKHNLMGLIDRPKTAHKDRTLKSILEEHRPCR
jgi:IMP dehydrogenase